MGNYIQYPVINHNGKEYKKEYVCVCVYIYVYMYLNYFAIQQKLTQHCKSIILQLNIYMYVYKYMSLCVCFVCVYIYIYIYMTVYIHMTGKPGVLQSMGLQRVGYN